MASNRMQTLAALLFGAAFLGGSTDLRAQAVGPIWDLSQLPETRGTVKQYTLTPRGDVDVLILTDGTEVKLPPHLTGQVVFAIRPGDAITIRGLRAIALPLIQAATATNDATHLTVADNGPPNGPGRAGSEQTMAGRVVTPLHGARGELNGAVLDTGITIYMPPEDAARMQSSLQPGQPVTVRGFVLATLLGTVVDVTSIGPSPDQMSDLAPRPLGPHGRDRAGPPDRGPPAPPPGPPARPR